jgi:hypothetical protein
MDLKEQYMSALQDLKCNSKPIIDQLAMLAGENIGNSSVIVECIEERIVKVLCVCFLEINDGYQNRY